MWLHFSVKYAHGKKRTYRLFSAEIEDLMEVLNYFVMNGCQIRSAVLIDADGRRTELPLQVFDGGAVADSMRRLETEYHTVFVSLSANKR